MDIQALMDSAGLDEEGLQALLQSFGAGTAGEELGNINRKMGAAQGLMDTPTPGMRNVGNTTSAANPMEFMAQLLKQHRGRQQMDAQDTAYDSRLELLRKQRAEAAAAAAAGKGAGMGGGMGGTTGMYGRPSTSNTIPI